VCSLRKRASGADDVDAVAPGPVVCRHDGEAFPEPLGGEHAVEWIVVMRREPSRHLRVREGDRERSEAARGHGRNEVVRRFELADRALDRVAQAEPHDYAAYVPWPSATPSRSCGAGASRARRSLPGSHRDADDVARGCGPSCPAAASRPDRCSRATRARRTATSSRGATRPLIEDDCKSIGADEVAHRQLRPALRARTRSIVVPEFGGVDHLPDSLDALVGSVS
jgi:hypothetical protein